MRECESALEVLGIRISLIFIVDIISHLPHLQQLTSELSSKQRKIKYDSAYLHDVILRDRAYNPGLVRVP